MSLRQFAIGIWLVFAASVGRADVFIDFDHDPAATPIITGTEITTLYDPLGVEFYTQPTGGYGLPGSGYDGDSVLTGGYVGDSGHPGHYVTPPNVVSFRTTEGNNWRRYRDDWAYGYANFLSDKVVFVAIVASIDTPSVEQNAYIVASFDDGSTQRNGMLDGALRQTLGIQAPAGRHITRLEYHGQGYEGTGSGVYYDNLTFATPEPGTALLVVIGLGAMMVVGRRRRMSRRCLES